MDGRSIAKLGVLSSGAVAIYVFEAMLPSPIPWAKIGLSNTFVLIVLFAFGLRHALVVNLVRVVAGNLLLGVLFSPAFVLSLGGSVTAVLVMGLLWHLFAPPLSAIGISCLGAVTNNIVQVILFTLLLTRSVIAGPMLGGFILLGVGVGVVTGFIAARIVEKLQLESHLHVG